jgi:ATP-dependent Clp protease ATP-binding subunit ClpA
MRRLYPEAQRLATAAGRPEAGADDLLLAALELPDGAARAALADCGVTARDLRAATADVRATDATAPHTSPGPSASAPSMPVAFHRAIGIAKAGRSHVRSTEILLAIVESPEGIVPRALVALGVDLEALRAAVRDRTPA